MSPSKWFLLLVAVLCAACQSISTTDQAGEPWQSAHLRILEAPNISDPSFDLVAAYARLTRTDLEIRFDLLGSPDPFGYDLYVAVNTGAGGGSHLPLGAQPTMDWDLTLGFPAHGLPRAFNASGATVPIRPRILRDSVQDSVTIRFSRKELTGNPLHYQIYAYIVEPGQDQVSDGIGPLVVSGPAPDVQAQLALAFWDVFPSATPAQALRRWSGAHTGPYGQRHGLHILLDAAGQNGVPLALLDLKRPEQLAALETVGGMPAVKQLLQAHLLVLPDLSYGDPQVSERSRQVSRASGNQFGIPASPFLYSTSAVSDPNSLELSETTQAVFLHKEDSSHMLLLNNIRLIPLPEPAMLEDIQVNGEGPTIAVRTALLKAALSPDSANLVVLGGDLPNSPWGDSLHAAHAFRYIAGHPWINALDAEELLHFPTVPGVYQCPAVFCPVEQEAVHPYQPLLRQALEAAPDGLFRDLAWQVNYRLTEPTRDTRLQALRNGYLGQVGPLLAASHWNAAPEEQSSCETDINWDGITDCILSSQNIFLILDPMGGSLVFAAARLGNEPFQWIGPRSQFVVGLGDSLEWRPERGLAGDPQEIHGAFADPPGNWQQYQAETQPGMIILTHPENGTRKTFQLTEQGVNATIEDQPPGPEPIPLALVDRQTYKPGGFGRYHLTQETLRSGEQIFAWGVDHGAAFSITLRGTGGAVQSFTDSRSLLEEEDPNIGYPPGHFTPYPMAVIELQHQGTYSIEFLLRKP